MWTDLFSIRQDVQDKQDAVNRRFTVCEILKIP